MFLILFKICSLRTVSNAFSKSLKKDLSDLFFWRMPLLYKNKQNTHILKKKPLTVEVNTILTWVVYTRRMCKKKNILKFVFSNQSPAQKIRLQNLPLTNEKWSHRSNKHVRNGSKSRRWATKNSVAWFSRGFVDGD